MSYKHTHTQAHTYTNKRLRQVRDFQLGELKHKMHFKGHLSQTKLNESQDIA